jgi:hypothetical protein
VIRAYYADHHHRDCEVVTVIFLCLCCLISSSVSPNLNSLVCSSGYLFETSCREAIRRSKQRSPRIRNRLVHQTSRKAHSVNPFVVLLFFSSFSALPSLCRVQCGSPSFGARWADAQSLAAI